MTEDEGLLQETGDGTLAARAAIGPAGGTAVTDLLRVGSTWGTVGRTALPGWAEGVVHRGRPAPTSHAGDRLGTTGSSFRTGSRDGESRDTGGPGNGRFETDRLGE